ncbi:MAG: hypothetical protein ABIZ81_14045 [Opitutaceae bacterium]
MSDNVLIPLPTFNLPVDFPWRVRFISAVDEHLRRLRATGHFRPSRFFGYYFRGESPMGVSGNWTVTLDVEPPLVQMKAALDRITKGKFSIASSADVDPDFLLVHDRRDGACWLWRFEYGLRFVEAIDAVSNNDRGTDQAENRKLLGP